MKFEFFKPKIDTSTPEVVREVEKEEIKGTGLDKSKIVAVLGGLSMLAPTATEAANNKTLDHIPNPVIRHAEAPVDVNKKIGNFSMTDKESNEMKEKQFDLAFAKEAVAHADKGGYISNLESMRGCVLVAEKSGSGSGSSFSNHLVIKAFKATADKMDGYRIMNVGFDGKELDENSSLKVSSRINGMAEDYTNYLYFVYTQLRDKMSPLEIKRLIKKANPNLNVDLLISSLEQSKIKVSQEDAKSINGDILALKQAPKLDGQLLAEMKNNE